MGRLKGAGIAPHPPIIIPEIGRGNEREALNTIEGMNQLKSFVDKLEVDTIIVISPHGTLFRDAISVIVEENLFGDFTNFARPDIQMSFSNNLPLIEKIFYEANKLDIPIAKLTKDKFKVDLDWGVLVPLYFINKDKAYNIIPITYGLLPPEDLKRFGRAIRSAIIKSASDVFLLASGDLSHKLKVDGPYGFDDAGPKFDDEVFDIINKSEFNRFINFDTQLADDAGECGLRSFQILAGVLDELNIESKVFSHESPFGVGYMTAAIKINDNLDDSKRKAIIDIAKFSIRRFLENGERANEEDLVDIINKRVFRDLKSKRAGVFVSLHKGNNLRGCIGTILPVRENIIQEILNNALSAAFEDPRFPPITTDELEELNFSVDLLSKPKAISSLDELDVKRYGVIVSNGFRRGLLLPNLDGVDDVEHQVLIALNKAGIRPEEGFSLERFEVIRYEE